MTIMTERGDSVDLLDHGLLRLVDYMGSDLSVVRNARVSYDAEWQAGDDEKGDKKLINYLLVNGHNTPFEAGEIQFEVKAPIFVFRQWHRHRTQSYNELSARYRPLPEEFYVPEIELITMQSTDNKQMRTEEQHPDAEWWREASAANMAATFDLYRQAIEKGIPRELARVPLPVGTYSHMFAKANLFNWFRFLKERSHPHAQYEIRVFADSILSMLSDLFPVSTEAFMKKYEHVGGEPELPPRSCGDCRHSRVEKNMLERQFFVGCQVRTELELIPLGDLDGDVDEKVLLVKTFEETTKRATPCPMFEKHWSA